MVQFTDGPLRCEYQALVAGNAAWCAKSSCCASHHLEQVTRGEHGVPPLWEKVAAVRQLLASRRQSVIFLDLDTLMIRPKWCPSDKLHFSIAPDPSPYYKPGLANTGFFAVRNSRVGQSIMDSWWNNYVRNASACWAPSGACRSCLHANSCSKEHRTCCRCGRGGECASQSWFNKYILSTFRSSIELLGRGFQSSSRNCDGTVKHFLAGINLASSVSVLHQCT